jgi:ferredoxin
LGCFAEGFGVSTGEKDRSGLDIFQLLKAASERKTREDRRQILESLSVHEFFEDGGISIDGKTCRGVECKLCIEACPTHALYWKSGEVGIEENLCVYCAACVLSCIVDDCIRVQRRRPSGEVEAFSNPRQAFLLLRRLRSGKRSERMKSVLQWTRDIPYPSRARILSGLVKMRKLRESH